MASEPHCVGLICKERGDMNPMVTRRQYYLTELNKLLEHLESSDCPQKVDCFKEDHARPVINYPGYVEAQRNRIITPPFQPLITNVPIKEIRPTSEYYKTYTSNSPILQYVPIEQKLHCEKWAKQKNRSCTCQKHNGLQPNCDKSECDQLRMCRVELDPSTTTSLAYVDPPPKRQLKSTRPMQWLIKPEPIKGIKYCCCSEGPQYKKIGGKTYIDCNHFPSPDLMRCYQCKQIQH